MNATRDTMNRKHFISGLARIVLFGSMAFIAGILVSRRNVTLTGCASDLQCKQCRKVTSCSLPEAKKFRKNGEGRTV
jgi:hypothetical protein